MDTKIQTNSLESFRLDPRNPRLGRTSDPEQLTQEKIYEIMKDWSLEELATSFLESGFWVQEALLCVRENIGGEEALIVVEGNRRLAALYRLAHAFDGREAARKWQTLISDLAKPTNLFHEIPYIELASRAEVDAFLGFRHVTGIKEWAPPEKARFIAKLIDEYGWSYIDVMRRIGSKTPTVQRNYIAYSMLLQMEAIEDIDTDRVEDKFSVLFLSLRSNYIQRFLGIKEKFDLPPDKVNPPVPEDYIANLKQFAQWVFGDDKKEPIVSDSRYIDKFATVIASKDGLEYLKSVRRPSLDKAFVIAGGDKQEAYELISTAAYNVEESLSSIHHFADDPELLDLVKRLSSNVRQLKKVFEIE